MHTHEKDKDSLTLSNNKISYINITMFDKNLVKRRTKAGHVYYF